MCSPSTDSPTKLQEQSRVPCKALIFTQNTTRNPISWNPALRQVNPNEVLHSVHLALHRALDPCTNGCADACSWALVNPPDDFTQTVDDKGSQTSSLSSSGKGQTLVIPRVSDFTWRQPGPKDTPEISIKLRFYGPHDSVDRKTQIDEALKYVEQATGFKEFNRFLIGFDGVRWAGGDEVCAKGEEEVNFLYDSGVWKHMSENSALKTLGVSDFSSFHLNTLISKISKDGSLRRPQLNQLNFERDLPDALVGLAKEEGVELQSHADNRGEWGH
ncbi:hypothetical protein FRB90_001127 [Tulasnella sp. 427]|nr:hypothetical protein FRB90_001127 [Tulasnella sp. 427]